MPARTMMASDMAETWRNCFEEELICPICLHVFSDPIQLPCKHNFCRGCISEAWAKDSSLARCPECNHAYTQKPSLEKNHKLSNIVEKYNALSVEKATTPALQCILCRRGPPLPAVKVCLRCNAPCCQSHIQTHLQQPCSALGHLLVEAEAVKAWTCPQHDEYRLYHCEAEQTAVCQYCCFARCHPSHGHAVTDVELRRNDIRQSLLRQQERVEERVQEIEEQLCKLDSDKCVVEDRVCELKEEVRLQYQRMHQLLEEDLGRTLEALERAQARFCQDNAAQVLALGEQRHEAQKLLSSIHTAFSKAEELSFMKNTKPVKILTDRSQACVGSSLPPYKVGNLNSKLFLSEISKREKSLKRTLEAPLTPPSTFLQSVPAYPSGQSSASGAEKRKHSTAFPEGNGNVGKNTTLGFKDSSSSSSSSSSSLAKQPYLGSGSASGEGQSTNQQPLGPCGPPHISESGGAGSGSGSLTNHHSGSVFGSSHFPPGGSSSSHSSQQAVLPQYGGRKILVCTMDNCYCSGVPSVSGHRSHPPYPRSGSFPWVSAQDYPPPPGLASGGPSMQGLAVRDWIDASQTHRHADFYGLYGQPSTKHYVTS
ncbi:E3 ubiquitin-protein ligase TRIM8b [Thunnus albacares]|uniref:E3 ubiquitin-protein ligase TRIM8b n=1 Tax=Thunnus maccoyii TaxID=8240 RepID=UPI001C4C7C0A|nr:E3 ubiquitin-protein ligase TRIM8b [Thunnus maccoyii]XP_042253299.1 E3 ubiquitin-protein ligase TRIM8b [Thunnus maccoyii]XP_042253300.1 E3 ubiquitin-protein ligase TRIM8b [Thunnus maccoyii]XP_044193221.1 E3 ubiquitin-protein ligase TRIM8b [Thunnus albacares]